MHLDARPNHARNVIHHLSGIHDFVCSVHLDARMIPPRYGMKCGVFLTCFFVQQVARYRGEWFNLGAWLTISCNKLHATGALFHMVACILMHEWFHLGSEWSSVVFVRVFSCNELQATGSVIPYCSAHLDARQNHAWNVIHHFGYSQFRATSCTLREIGLKI